MQEVVLPNVGVEIDPRDIVHEDLIAYVENLNPDLGVEGKDVYFKEYNDLLREINSAQIVTVDTDQFNIKNKFDDADISLEDEKVSTDFDSIAFALLMNGRPASFNEASPIDLTAGQEFAPVFEWQELYTEFIPFRLIK